MPRLLTLTTAPADDPDDARRALARRFEHLRQRVAVRTGGRMEYAAVVELTAAGRPHLHVVYRGPYLRQALWSELAAASGFGPIVDIRRVRSADVARYAAKGLGGYLGKSFGQVWPSHFRRVRFSRSWAVRWEARRRVSRAEGEAEARWERVRPGDRLWDVYAARRALDGVRGSQGPPAGPVAVSAARKRP